MPGERGPSYNRVRRHGERLVNKINKLSQGAAQAKLGRVITKRLNKRRRFRRV